MDPLKYTEGQVKEASMAFCSPGNPFCNKLYAYPQYHALRHLPGEPAKRSLPHGRLPFQKHMQCAGYRRSVAFLVARKPAASILMK
jgi:hypothetical protein